jgi:hypothetical protein
LQQQSVFPEESAWQLVGEVKKTRFFGFLSATLTGESRLITGRKPGFSDK